MNPTLYLLIWWILLVISNYGKLFQLFVHNNIYCVGAGKSTLMSFFDDLGRWIFRPNMEKTQPMTEEVDGEVVISRPSRHCLFVVNMNKVLFPTCTLTWRVNSYVSHQGKSTNRRNMSIFVGIFIFHFDYELTVQIVTSYSPKNHIFRYAPKLI